MSAKPSPESLATVEALCLTLRDGHRALFEDEREQFARLLDEAAQAGRDHAVSRLLDRAEIERRYRYEHSAQVLEDEAAMIRDPAVRRPVRRSA